VTAFIASFMFVMLAEMGDKTQLLAMSFAARYKAWQVLVAVFIATFLNHTLAVLAGRLLTTVVPMDIISFVAALSFIIFGLWTIRGDKLEGEDKKESHFGPIATVAIAFFLVEMGDKTQLTTISLAIKYQNLTYVLLGTTLGMVVADAFGIIVGVVMRKHIPEKIVKLISASIFILFGFIGVHRALVFRVNIFINFGILALLGAATATAGSYLCKKSCSNAEKLEEKRNEIKII
jgi:putative Ca2+/H+ antiporter (TMEM165/GDT1 family)